MIKLINTLAETLSKTLKQQVIDPAVIDQGAVWVRAFQKEFPMFSFFVNRLINGSPGEALDSLISVKPDLEYMRNNRLAIQTIAALQKKLKGIQRSI